MAKHNKKYHSEQGPHHALVYNVVSGPNMGKMVWQMGHLKFAHLDSRPKVEDTTKTGETTSCLMLKN